MSLEINTIVYLWDFEHFAQSPNTAGAVAAVPLVVPVAKPVLLLGILGYAEY